MLSDGAKSIVTMPHPKWFSVNIVTTVRCAWIERKLNVVARNLTNCNKHLAVDISLARVLGSPTRGTNE